MIKGKGKGSNFTNERGIFCSLSSDEVANARTILTEELRIISVNRCLRGFDLDYR